MSADGDATAPHEVVIVRRRAGDGEEGHHGGAWKIAFADLMTAMMAFFLVMWLLNVSDKEKISQIATYFNPLKLNSKRPTTKGMEEERETTKSAPETVGPADYGPNISDVEDDKKRQGASKPGGDGELKEGVAHQAEEELFNDPFGVLARLALKASDSENPSETSRDSALPGGGDAFTNPFEPFAERPITPEAPQDQIDRSLDTPGLPLAPSGAEVLPEIEAEIDDEPVEPKKAQADSGPADAETAAKDGADAGKNDADQNKVTKLEAEIAQMLAELAPGKKPAIGVQRVDEGLLISLMDDFRFGMFALSSAVPQPELVVVMEKIAKVLKGHEGEIKVRGHTDARPFRSERNSNWRLSMERAQMAYYMLVRGGIPEQRFESIEGRADRDLKVPTDPNAAENRRIEILIKMPKP